MHRARHLAKHLSATGWRPTVVCVDERFHEERLDPELARMVPGDLDLVKVEALPTHLARPLGVGDIGIRGYVGLRRAVMQRLDRQNVGAVMITGSPYYPMLLAPELRRRGVPVLLDFQDPWVSAWGAGQPPLSKAGLSHRLACLLEPKAVRAASFITSVSELQNAEMARRYPGLDRTRMSAVPIGGDPDDYAALARDSIPKSDGCFRVVYAGTIWPAVAPTLQTFLRALQRLRDVQPRLFDKLRLSFIGTSADPNGVNAYRVLPAAEALGVARVVEEIPQRVPYLQALERQAQGDANLILGSPEAHYTASKIFGVLMTGRPYLSVLHESSSAHAILTKAGGGAALSFASATDLDGLEVRLAEALAALATNPEAMGRADPAAYADYTAEAVAKTYGGIFDKLSAESRGGFACA